MPEFFGFCGRATPTPCSLVWLSTYPNKVGVYPSQLLPAIRTVYHLTSDSGFNFSPPLQLTSTPFGTALTGLVGAGPPQTDVFTPQSHLATIFARTANRLNVTHIVTSTEIQEAASNDGIARIDVGEFIFEVIAVTDQKEAIETELSEEEIEAIQDTNESESDRVFRKLFEQDIPDGRNRLVSLEINKRGIEYRFDNGGPKINSALKLAGVGDLTNPSYRDASSRVLNVDLVKITDRLEIDPGQPIPPEGSLQASAREPKAGDIIYLTYIGVKDHYFRQNVEASYLLQGVAIPPQVFGFPTDIKVANYRFYEWNISPDDPQDLPVKISGWRVVETFNTPANVIAPVGQIGAAELGQFLITKGRGLVTVNVLDGKDLTVSQLDKFILNRADFESGSSSYSLNLNQIIFDGNYHQQVDSSFKLAPWYLRQGYRVYDRHSDVVAHVFYNTHPSAMLKRDVDKYGIERFLAQQVEIDIKQDKDTFFPFMDDVELIDPTTGVQIFLDSSNTRFEPIEPISRYSTANLEVEVGVAGAVQLGFTGSTDDIVAVFVYNSNIITERLEDDTRLLAERHFTTGRGIGARSIAIEGLAGRIGALTCITDPSHTFAFTAHVNEDNLLIFNKFTTGWTDRGVSELHYRPDLDAPPVVDNSDPKPEQFEEFLGYNGLLGDNPGIKPGAAVSATSYAAPSSFRYKTTNRDDVINRFPNITDDQVEEISITRSDNRITIPIGSGYSGRTDIQFTCENPDGVKALMQFKSGNNLDSVVDTIFFPTATKKTRMSIPHHWLRGETIELVGDNIDDVIVQNITVLQIDDSKAEDFLNDESSSVPEDKNSVLDGIFYDRSIFFSTDVMSLAEDSFSRLFIFFNDNDGGISCVQSDDFGLSWAFHYGVIEAINQEEARNPFILNFEETNSCFVFYMFKSKILCKYIPFDLFQFEDALLIERFEADRLRVADGQTTELSGLFSTKGKVLRRDLVAFAAAGDLTDDVFRELTGRNLDTNAYEALEEREVETEDGIETQLRRKNLLSISPGTAFTNKNIEDIHFSVYQTDAGILKLFFLLAAREDIGGGNQLQCHFSVDNGRTWFDYWEWIENKYNRIRTDGTRKTQWIDRNASGDPPEGESGVRGTDPIDGDQLAYFGINVHWSRLSKHKIGEASINSESQVVEIESPYVFYQSSTKKVFLFYIYSGCLLCKVFSDEVFSLAATAKRTDPENGGMSKVVNIIERETRAYFVDGDLANFDIREEIHRFFNEDANEIMAQGNIVFTHQFGIDAFKEYRRIKAQRVCAYELPQGGVRVFYKHDTSKDLHAAIYTGSDWVVEDLLKTPGDPIPEFTQPTGEEVCGAFGGSGFPCKG